MQANIQGHDRKAHIIVVANEKGGSGKTTTAMHLVVALQKLGFQLGSMDIDSRQKSLTRYLENRHDYARRHSIELASPEHQVVVRSPFLTVEEMEEDETFRFTEALRMLARHTDFIVIDSPGSDMFMSRLAHSYADTVITPINDSFIDLDVLAHIDAEDVQKSRPSIYSEMLWEQKVIKAKRGEGAMDWIVMRNRLSNLDARNKRRMADGVEHLAKRIGFRLAPGFSERVIFRELFLEGLTVMDLDEEKPGVSMSLSHIAAREEVRQLLKSLNIPKLDEALARKDDSRPQATVPHPLDSSSHPASVRTDETPSAESRPSAAPTPLRIAPREAREPVEQPVSGIRPTLHLLKSASANAS